MIRKTQSSRVQEVLPFLVILHLNATRVAFATAILWAALGIDSLVRAHQDNRRDFVVLVPFTLTAIVLWLIGQMQSTARDRLERLTSGLL